MRQISFEEIGSVVATFYADGDVRRGYVVGINKQENVGVSVDGGPVCGVAVEVSPDGMAGVQISGFATVPYSGNGVVPGWVSLVSNGSGGVRQADTGETGHEFLVVKTTTTPRTAVVLL